MRADVAIVVDVSDGVNSGYGCVFRNVDVYIMMLPPL